MSPKIAVIGTGYWGKNLVRNFHDLGHLAAVCDVNELVKTVYEGKYPDVPFVTNYSEVLEDGEIDGIVLATPAVTHFRMAKAALYSGKHVFVEKPLALEVSEGEALISLAEKEAKVLMVGHILQFHPAVIKLKEIIDKGDLGKIQYIYSNRLNIGKIRTEENILWSFAPHDISVILMLLGEAPKNVFSSGGNYLQAPVADVTMTTMNFSSGVRAHIFVSWLHPFKEQKLVVVGDRKMAVFDDVSENKLVLYPHEIKWVDRVPVASKSEAETVPVEMKEPLKEECRHFIQCIKEARSPMTDGREGLRVLKVLSASQASLDQQGVVIHLGDFKGPKEPLKKPASSGSEYFAHESAYIDEGVEIGKGTTIWHFSHVMNNARLGENCRIGQNVVIGRDVSVGNGCKIQNNVSVYEGVTLEDHVFCGPSMVFTNVYNPRSEIPRMSEMRETLVKRGVTIGANATIVCGHTIGEYAFIGAGAVVTGDVPSFALVVGNPGEIKGWMCKCGLRLKVKGSRAQCAVCEEKYELKDGRIELAQGR